MRKNAFRTAQALARALAPGIYRRISYYRNEGRLQRIAARLGRRYGAVVLDGPFKGMKYVSGSAGSVYAPKLVGSYEAELHAAIERVVASSYERVVDIGCAEGYYAVGLLLRMQNAKCIAFDLDPRARHLCQQMAECNGVAARLEVRGCCDAKELRAVLSCRTFVLSDCEGAELDLLDPAVTPALRSCDLLVELHDFIRPGTRLALEQRFGVTHRMQIFEQVDRDPGSYPHLSFLSQRDRQAALQEFRPVRMQWMMFTARPLP